MANALAKPLKYMLVHSINDEWKLWRKAIWVSSINNGQLRLQFTLKSQHALFAASAWSGQWCQNIRARELKMEDRLGKSRKTFRGCSEIQLGFGPNSVLKLMSGSGSHIGAQVWFTRPDSISVTLSVAGIDKNKPLWLATHEHMG